MKKNEIPKWQASCNGRFFLVLEWKDLSEAKRSGNTLICQDGHCDSTILLVMGLRAWCSAPLALQERDQNEMGSEKDARHCR